ncbi:hypothetical protein D3C75_1243400 [compost metagenome]
MPGKFFTARSLLPAGIAMASAGGLVWLSMEIGCARAAIDAPNASTTALAMMDFLFIMMTLEPRLIGDAEHALVDADGLIALMRDAGLNDEAHRRHVGDRAR